MTDFVAELADLLEFDANLVLGPDRFVVGARFECALEVVERSARARGRRLRVVGTVIMGSGLPEVSGLGPCLTNSYIPVKRKTTGRMEQRFASLDEVGPTR